jgi:hypothetical protein
MEQVALAGLLPQDSAPSSRNLSLLTEAVSVHMLAERIQKETTAAMRHDPVVAEIHAAREQLPSNTTATCLRIPKRLKCIAML